MLARSILGRRGRPEWVDFSSRISGPTLPPHSHPRLRPVDLVDSVFARPGFAIAGFPAPTGFPRSRRFPPSARLHASFALPFARTCSRLSLCAERYVHRRARPSTYRRFAGSQRLRGPRFAAARQFPHRPQPRHQSRRGQACRLTILRQRRTADGAEDAPGVSASTTTSENGPTRRSRARGERTALAIWAAAAQRTRRPPTSRTSSPAPPIGSSPYTCFAGAGDDRSRIGPRARERRRIPVSAASQPPPTSPGSADRPSQRRSAACMGCRPPPRSTRSVTIVPHIPCARKPATPPPPQKQRCRPAAARTSGPSSSSLTSCSCTQRLNAGPLQRHQPGHPVPATSYWNHAGRGPSTSSRGTASATRGAGLAPVAASLHHRLVYVVAGQHQQKATALPAAAGRGGPRRAISSPHPSSGTRSCRRASRRPSVRTAPPTFLSHTSQSKTHQPKLSSPIPPTTRIMVSNG